MDPELFGRTLRFHPCLRKEGKEDVFIRMTFEEADSLTVKKFYLTGDQVKTLLQVEKCTQTHKMDEKHLLWKWLWLSCGETTAMCTGVHLPTMHCHMAISLFHNPPVLLLQEDKNRKLVRESMHETEYRIQVCLMVSHAGSWHREETNSPFKNDLKVTVCLISLTDVLFDRAKCFLILKKVTTKI